MANLDWNWIVYIASIYIEIFIILLIIKFIFKDKIKNINSASSISTGSVGIISTIVSICLACAVPILGFMGFLFNFPSEIVALMLGSSLFVIGDLIIKHLEKKNKTFFLHNFIINLGLTLVGVVILILLYGNKDISHDSDIHYHVDLKVYKDGQLVNLYNDNNMERDPLIHFHDGKDEEWVIHYEGKRGTIKDFFDTIDFDIDDTCLFIVNGKQLNVNINSYLTNDLDKVLITCNPTNLQEEINSIGSNACIQSKKC